MPVGVQLVGRHLDEATILRAGHAFQRETDWHRRRPPL
jgi:Asp-tRNA(Asn)/Glu-tRNA(Gln) amidotransferase A subunit family amidase